MTLPARRSTWVLMAVFGLVLSTYLLVRPATAATTPTAPTPLRNGRTTQAPSDGTRGPSLPRTVRPGPATTPVQPDPVLTVAPSASTTVTPSTASAATPSTPLQLPTTGATQPASTGTTPAPKPT